MSFFGGIIQKSLTGNENVSSVSYEVKFQYKNFQFFTNGKFPFIKGHLNDDEYYRISKNYHHQQSLTVNGKWTIIDLNIEAGKLFLVRDILGICPIYYCDEAKFFAFSNRIEFFKEIEGFKWELNRRSIGKYLIFNEIVTISY